MLSKAIILVIIPAEIANVLHMIVVKKDLFSNLSIPISKALFGINKTWRGLLFSAISTSLICAFTAVIAQVATFNEGLWIGAILGLVYMLFELPNSFIKRKFGIASGQEAEQYKWLFLAVDKMDSAFGVSFVYYLLSDLSVLQAIYLFLIASSLHVTLSYILVMLGIKKRF